MTEESIDPGREIERRPPFGRTLAALAIGGAAQYALTHGFPEIGGVGYGVAVWLFVSSAGGYLDWDVRDEEAEPAGEAAPGEGRRAGSRLVFILNNWRAMTLSDLLSGASIPHEVKQEVANTSEQMSPAADRGTKRGRLAVIMQDWRQMSISQILKTLSTPAEDDDESA